MDFSFQEKKNERKEIKGMNEYEKWKLTELEIKKNSGLVVVVCNARKPLEKKLDPIGIRYLLPV